MSLPNFWRVDEWVKSIQGLAISGAHVYVISQPVSSLPTSEQLGPPSPLATTYTDSTGGTQLPQPLVTDSFGHTDGYVAPGLYTIAIYNNGTLQQSYADQNIGAAGLTNGGGLVAGTAISIVGNTISGAYVAGTGITIVNGVITNTAAGATYTAGSGISINGSNVISNTAQAPSFTVSGQGWFAGPGMTSYADIFNTASNATLTNFSANTVLVYQFILTATWTLSSCSYTLYASSAGTHFNFGIYDVNKNKLIDCAFSGATTATQKITFGPTTLPAGVYYFAVSSTSSAITGPVIFSSNNATLPTLNSLNAATALLATAANSTSSNVLPSTLGTLTAITSILSWQGFPIPIWAV